MKIKVEPQMELKCSACGEIVDAVVDAPGYGGTPWGHWCEEDIAYAVSHWRESSITTMLVHSMDDVF
jgi:hypothetical protein